LVENSSQAGPTHAWLSLGRVIPSGEDKSFQVILATLCFTSEADLLKGRPDQGRNLRKRT